MNSEIVSACDLILAAAVNGLYQGIIMAVLVGVGLRLLGRTNAATRHALWFATLVLLAALIPAHCLRDCLLAARAAVTPVSLSTGAVTLPGARIDQVLLRTEVRVPELSGDRQVAETPVFPPESLTHPEDTNVAASSLFPTGGEARGENSPNMFAHRTPETLAAQALAGSPLLGERGRGEGEFFELSHGEVAGTVRCTEGLSLAGACALEDALATAQFGPPTADRSKQARPTLFVASSAAKVSAGENLSWWPERLLRPTSWSLVTGSKIPRLTSLVLLACWLGVGGIKAGIMLWRLRRIRRLKANAMPAGEGLDDLLERLRRQLAVSRRVRLKVSPGQRSPVLLGFRHPMVLLSAAEVFDLAHTEVILRHELAHVRRLDDWANLVQNVIQAVLFFHPAVWWISRQLSLQREIACDDYVLQQGGRPRTYALLLTDLASRIKTQRPLLAPGVTNSKSQLQKRIDMILNTRRDTSPRLAKSRLGFLTTAAALLAALAFYSAPRLVLAQASTAPPGAANVASNNALPRTPAAPAALPAPPAPPAAPAAEPAEVPAPVPPMIESGPKAKSQNSGDRVSENIIIAPAPTPAPPSVVVVGPVPVRAPHIVAVPRPAASPRPPRSPDSPESDSNLEQRLSRLEKMVESLLEKKEPKAEVNGFLYQDSPKQELRIDNEKIKLLQDRAEREAARAADQAKRGAKEAERALKLRQERDAQGKFKENFARQIEALQKHREMLEREVEKVQGQIERLEQEQEKLQDEQQHQSDLLEDQAPGAENMALLQEPCADPTDAPAALAE
ncbi:MAG TPA: M56 family metallopeptidase [Verrucomicrobiae bacterium]